MPTELVNSLLVNSNNSSGNDEPFEISVCNNNEIHITSQCYDATSWWLVIKEEDWESVKEFIDEKIKK